MNLERDVVFAGRYLIVRPLAAGGMARVYVARSIERDEVVALKVLNAPANRRTSKHRFALEASVSDRIVHPGIVRVFDAGVDEHGRFYFAMELLSGSDFAALMDDPRVGARDLLGHLAEGLHVLGAAHAAGLVHRDIKPENLFLERREDGSARVRLLDFGIARELGRAGVTAPGSPLGTAAYMAPEQAMDGSKVCEATDVWACGVLLYELLAGRLPFCGETPHDLIVQVVRDHPTPLSELRPELPRGLCDLVHRCLAKSIADRPTDARELARELERCLEEAGDVELSPREMPPDSTTPTIADGEPRSAPPVTRSGGAWHVAAVVIVIGFSLLATALVLLW